MTDTLTAQGLFTGGVILLNIASQALPSTWSLVRTYGDQSTSIPVVSSTGEGFRVYLDSGYNLDGALPTGVAITYTLTTANGSTSATVTLAPKIYLTSDSFLETITAALKATVKNVVLPDSTSFLNRATVRQAMPLTQSPPLPFISVEEVAQHQAHRQIGAHVDPDTTRNIWVIAEQADLRYHIGVFTRSIEERQFWKSAVLATLKALVAQIAPVLGQDNTVSYQISQGQVPPEDLPPGFYFAEVGFNISGPTSIVVKTDYPTNDGIDVTINSDLSVSLPRSL